jgi:uncharacterized membrane protein
MQQGMLDKEATPDNLRCLARQGMLSSTELERALSIAGVIPGGKAWGQFLSTLFLLLGSVLIVAGIIFFFAYNWASMHRLLKLGMVQIALLTAIVLGFYHGPDKLAGKASLLAASMLVGALLALFGQIYQTGADAYELFLGWSVLILGWVAISNFAALWLLLLLLMQTTVYFYWAQVVESSWFGFRSPIPYEIIFSINVAGLALWEFFSSRGVSWLRGRWMPRFCASLGLFVLMIPLLLSIVTSDSYGHHMQHVLLLWLFYLCSGGFVMWFYRSRVFDLYMLAIVLLSGIVLVTVFLAHAMAHDYGGFLLLSFLVVGMSTGAAAWLRSIALSRSSEVL